MDPDRTSLDDLFRELAQQNPQSNAFPGDLARKGRAMLSAWRAQLRLNICGNARITQHPAIAGTDDVNDMVALAALVATEVPVDIGVGFNRILIAAMLVRMGIRRFCAGYSPDDAKPSPLMVHLTYSFIDFAIGHELGHRLLGHQGTAGDRDDRLAAEKDADRLGFHLFSTSWGWRDEILDGSPLSSAARIVLGPLTFAAFERWYAAALLGLAVACQRAGSDAGFDVFGMKRIREEARARTRDTAQLVAGYKAAIAKGGVNLNEIDTAVIGALSRSMVAFVGTTMTSASSVPAGQIRLAREIARPVF